MKFRVTDDIRAFFASFVTASQAQLLAMWNVARENAAPEVKDDLLLVATLRRDEKRDWTVNAGAIPREHWRETLLLAAGNDADDLTSNDAVWKRTSETAGDHAAWLVLVRETDDEVLEIAVGRMIRVEDLMVNPVTSEDEEPPESGKRER